ncbi:MAG: putative short-chain dehydrogenase [Microbacteriaceae bacterium]|nr:putative short-chain dehydrogenase [Microbacteriaceae bacterium]
MTITLITGGNKGLGFETARRLIDLGHTVWIGARDPELGQAAADTLGARFVRLDVTDQASVDAAAAVIRSQHGHLDLLVNNAGIAGGLVPPRDVTAADLERVYATNVFGLVRVTHAMLGLLDAAEHPVIVNVSSGLGSSTRATDPEAMESAFTPIAYGSSKAAVVALTVQYAKALPGMRVNVVDPGYTGTDLNGNRGTQTVTEGTDAIVAMATVAPDGPTGTFTDRNGSVPF